MGVPAHSRPALEASSDVREFEVLLRQAAKAFRSHKPTADGVFPKRDFGGILSRRKVVRGRAKKH